MSTIDSSPPFDAAFAAEEIFYGENTGVEVESGEPGHIIKPWDPEKIRVTTKNFSLRNVLDMIDSGDLELAPDFQRNRVWKSQQKSRLIESVLLQIPLPAFYFAEDQDGLLRVVDGLQRLSTIHDFARSDSFKLHDLEYLSTHEGSTFDKLGNLLQRRLHNTQIVVHVIDPTTPDDVKYDIFKRINTGGEPLNGMEIRHCMSRSRSRNFLKKCANSKVFNEATNGTLYNHVRMHDRESALRFIAFRLLPEVSDYENFESMERLLDWAARELDDPNRVPDTELARLFEAFERAMENAQMIFGQHAFRKWPIGSERLSPINRALLESWAIALADEPPTQLSSTADAIRDAAREAMTNDYRYIESISSSTADARRVRQRFGVAQKLVGQTK